VVEAILTKHDIATNNRRFNAILATASISQAIEYYDLFKTMQAERVAQNPDFVPLNVACVFSPPPEGNKDVQQIQEDLQQEKADWAASRWTMSRNQQDTDPKKKALEGILAEQRKIAACLSALDALIAAESQKVELLKTHKKG
jgi:type I restriction enzyme, R subunit